MSTSSGRKGICERCGHMLNEHASKGDSKCTKCKKLFEICQAEIHGSDGRGWRLCYIPCSCGEKYYPDKARAAVPLAPHEYKADHPGYRPLPPDEEYEDTTEDIANSSPPPQGESWLAGHGRADSGSSDELSWGKARYEQEMGSIGGIVGGLDKTYIGKESTSNWSSWSWSKEYGQWVRNRETLPSKWEYEYQVLSGEWSAWIWSESWGQYERAAKDPDGNWRYDYEPPSTDTSKGKGKAKNPMEKGKGKEKEKDSAGPSDTSKGLLVKTVKAKKRKGVYYFTNEEGNDVETKESDWKKGNRYDDGTEYKCLVYVGKKSGRVYHTWQLG